MSTHLSSEQRVSVGKGLDFLWVELTNRCNLKCVHCYSESHPYSSEKDVLTVTDYKRVLRESAALGCKKVQFIGGEPTLNKDLANLIEYAKGLDYEFVEVFTNLNNLSAELLTCFVANKVAVATSVYSHDPEVHDTITKGPGSFRRTTTNIQKVIASGLELRAGIVVMEENKDHVEKTKLYLTSIGVTSVGTDGVRDFGRASHDTSDFKVKSLCGNCSGSTLCVGPDGMVTPCIMSKGLPIGSVLDQPMADLVSSTTLSTTRTLIYNEVVSPRQTEHHHAEGSCDPSCSPCYPNCSPACNPSCYPWCQPACGPSSGNY